MSPSVVKLILRVVRFSKRTFSVFSKAVICSLTLDLVIPNASAAQVKEPHSTTLLNITMRFNSFSMTVPLLVTLGSIFII
ncbi:Uncharacterised protein [Vibrio cholerae]|nr:Uncharacterised protein [Vibrio cholerae]CRZ97665.1 Uncharacterised protein [Vibrio cholerae]CSB19336.1 Uncharacterised protein [Vibrio cholerae]CSB54852.1 Uncharacterised protein [Vibrio cholerae]CSD52151.1 Uncharacterised protein [Vibrio cholerae]